MNHTMKSSGAIAVLAAAAALTGCGEKTKTETTSSTRSAAVTGEAGSKLVLVKPGAVTLRRGEMAKIDVECRRTNVPGEISVAFSELPGGVEVVDVDNKLLGEKGTYTLKASDSAALVEKRSAKVTATAPSGISVTETFDVSVKEKETATGR